MKIGDTVRFLDTVGGGRISRIDEQKKLVYVKDQNGFEMPTPFSQVVVVNNINANNFPLPEPETKDEPIQQRNSPQVVDIFETDYGNTLCVQLAFVPQNIRLLQSTPYDVVLLNDSNYYIYYTIVSVFDKKAEIRAHGFLEPNMTDNITELTKDKLNDWEHLRVQIIPFKQEGLYDLQSVVDVDLKLNLVNFFKLHAFTSNEYFDEPAWLINLTAQKPKIDYTQLTEKDKAEHKEPVKQKPRHRRIQTDEPLEVDLHINELLDNTHGMDKAAMLQYQIDTFQRVMKENLSHKGKKIVFIHGKGEGVLRKNIEDLLRKQYKTCRFQDASFQKYGFGATMVIIG